ncbi:nicotinate-nucleotide--dimethylbenzimidazole phosphoribosyltransferase [Xylanibacillus composti]|nr:nicotinate-nucleotide--dimethylbenzimidazole phosphoribosyltransferase [Xylanibacillus composti]
MSLEQICAKIGDLDQASGELAKQRLERLTKPPGSLGRLETLVIQLAEITGQPLPRIFPPGIAVFAGDHGIVAEGVSAFPQEVTGQMVRNFAAGGAAINVFARQIGAKLDITDVGTAADLSEVEGVRQRKVREGTGNFAREDAMSRQEAVEAIAAGIESAARLIEEGAECIIPGEMGIGNTTSSTAIAAVITGRSTEELTGAGTGLNPDARKRKAALIQRALEARKPDPADALDIISKIGGLEIAAMTGAILAAAARRKPVLLDGFICGVAAVLAVKLASGVRGYLIAGHRSQEPGHEAVLEWLGLEPLLDLQLRLGEGSGAAVAYPLLESAVRMLAEMATFESAGISGASSPS